jgi:hypothetical protein
VSYNGYLDLRLSVVITPSEPIRWNTVASPRNSVDRRSSVEAWNIVDLTTNPELKDGVQKRTTPQNPQTFLANARTRSTSGSPQISTIPHVSNLGNPLISKKYYFTLHATKTNVSYTLYARNYEEMAEWVSDIQQAINKAGSSTNQKDYSISGWLTKKGSRRFFIIKVGSHLQRYEF